MPVCTSVFILAENRLLREALSRILSKKSDINVVGTATHFPAVLSTIVTIAPQVLLFDPADVRAGIAFLRTLRDAVPELKVIMIGMEVNSEMFISTVREGIAGYMLVDANANEIVGAVRSVASGGAVCPPELCLALFRYVASRRTALPNFEVKDQFGLTRREQQFLALVSRGLTNKEIALELGLAEQTVKNHIHRMLRKMGVSDRLQAVEICRARGFLTASPFQAAD
jgi:DNA-binding NarL/FixJ family response regulator